MPQEDRRHREIKCKKPYSWYKLYWNCRRLCLTSGCRRVPRSEELRQRPLAQPVTRYNDSVPAVQNIPYQPHQTQYQRYHSVPRRRRGIGHVTWSLRRFRAGKS
eukprot:1774960-Rhodomonas_salina.1